MYPGGGQGGFFLITPKSDGSMCWLNKSASNENQKYEFPKHLKEKNGAMCSNSMYAESSISLIS